MPELPEVETVCTALRRHLPGAVIRNVDIQVPSLRNALDPEMIRTHVQDRRILDIRRRAKYIIVELEGQRALVLHANISCCVHLSDGS